MSRLFIDELERVLGPDRLHVPRRPWPPELDELRSYSDHTIRSLRGAGYITPRGLPADVLADMAGKPVCDFVGWYVDHARRAITEARRLAHHRRHLHHARRHGHRTYYEHRTAIAREAGAPSLWHYRRQRGWDGHPAPGDNQLAA